MKTLKTSPRPQNSRLNKTLLAASLFIITCSGFASAQTQFSNLLREGETEWMLGTWVGHVDGEEVLLTYKWELDKNLISIKFKTPEFKYQGLILYHSLTEEITQVGADTLGNTTKGTWDGAEGSATLTQTTTNEYGYTEVTAFKHMQVDKNTMMINVTPIRNTGYSDLYPTTQIEFKRKKN